MISLIFLVIGLIFGSFMNVLICRLPYGKSVVMPGSSCVKCGYKLKFYENIPVLSYIFLNGRCSNCKEKISFQYPLVEITTGVLFFLVYKYFGLTLLSFKMLVLVFLLLAIGFTDYFTSLDRKHFECGVIPVVLTRAGMLLGIVLSFVVQPGISSIVNSVLGAAIGGFIIWLPGYLYKLITKKDGMGSGDVELFGMIGSFLGYKPMFFILFLSSIIGAIGGSIVISIKKDKNYPIPFGPFISLATLVYIFYGDRLVKGYLNMIYGG